MIGFSHQLMTPVFRFGYHNFVRGQYGTDDAAIAAAATALLATDVGSLCQPPPQADDSFLPEPVHRLERDWLVCRTGICLMDAPPRQAPADTALISGLSLQIVAKWVVMAKNAYYTALACGRRGNFYVKSEEPKRSGEVLASALW